MTATSALVRHLLRGSRIRTASFALLFALIGYASAAGYRGAYPTLSDRIGFDHSFGQNQMFRLFYGVPRDLLSVGGYSAWRVAGFCSILAGAWGITSAVSALRGEEEAGRAETVLAAPVTRVQMFCAAIVALALGTVALWLATLLGLIAAGLALDGSAYLALATVAPAFALGAGGALASQLAATRRLALELASAGLALALAARVVADTATGLGWLRWATPLGWSEQMRAFTGPRPVVIALFVLASALLLALAAKLATMRDLDSGLLQGSDSHPPRLSLLSSPMALALREERLSLTVWIAGTALYGLITGMLSTSISKTNLPTGLQHELAKLGAGSITTPAGALGFYFLFFLVIVCLFACAQIAAVRREEAQARVETLLVAPLSRGRWLAGRGLLACAGAAAVALTAALTAWAGALTQGAGISLWRMLEAGANCLPLALMFLGLGLLAFGLVPRASSALAYGLLAAAFVWELFGSLLGASHWLVQLTPFQHVGLVPGQAIRLGDGALMLAVALASSLLAWRTFARRDLVGS